MAAQMASCTVLNQSADLSTVSPHGLILPANSKPSNKSFIVSDCDEELLLFIQFTESVSLTELTLHAFPIDDDEDIDLDASPPKLVHVYKTQNNNLDFNDVSSLTANVSLECNEKKLSKKGQRIKLQQTASNAVQFKSVRYLAIYIQSNQRDTEQTYLNAISLSFTATATPSSVDELLADTQQQLQSSAYKVRINRVLSKMDKTKNIIDLICAEYEDNISLFIQEYAQFINEIEREKQWTADDATNTCKVENCPFIRRHLEPQKKRNETGKGRRRRTLQRLCNNLHIYKYHLVESGLRQTRSDDEEKEKQTNAFTQIMNSSPQATTQQLVNSDKFITEVEEHKDTKYHPYSQGIRFYYHEYYKHNQKREELVPGSFYLDTGNIDVDVDYRFCDWYIPPKYNSLKEEICAVSSDIYQNEFEAAALKWEAMAKWIKPANNEWCIVYDMKENQTIEQKHILALLLYTNTDSLQRKFTKTFRRESKAETDEQLKQRHSEFAHWAKALRECVEVFGKYPDDAPNVRCFYHGVSQIMVFENFRPHFRSPTSTTTDLRIAAHFATNDQYGIVIVFENRPRTVNYFFDCAMWSDYPWEQETLFIGDIQRLQICGLMMMSNKIQYDEWIRAMRIFTGGFMDGSPSYDKIRKSDAENIGALIANVLQQGTDNQSSYRSEIPEYVQQLFRHMISKRKRIRIDIGYFSKDYICIQPNGLMVYGYLLLRHLYLTDSNEIKWSLLRKLYPSLRGMIITNSEPIANTFGSYKILPSIHVDDTVMSNMQSFLASYSDPRVDVLSIHQPLGSLQELEAIKTKYEASFQSDGYTLFIDAHVSDPQLGHYTRFAVFHQDHSRAKMSIGDTSTKQIEQEETDREDARSESPQRHEETDEQTVIDKLINDGYNVQKEDKNELLQKLGNKGFSIEEAKTAGAITCSLRRDTGDDEDERQQGADNDNNPSTKDIEKEEIIREMCTPMIAQKGDDDISDSQQRDIETDEQDEKEDEDEDEYHSAASHPPDCDQLLNQIIAAEQHAQQRLDHQQSLLIEQKPEDLINSDNMWSRCEQLLTKITDAVTKYAKQCPDGQGQASTHHHDQSQSSSSSNPLPSNAPFGTQTQFNQKRQNDDDDDKDDEKKNNNNNNNNGNPHVVFPQYKCPDCMIKDQMIITQIELLRQSAGMIKLLMDRNKALSPSASTSTSPTPSNPSISDEQKQHEEEEEEEEKESECTKPNLLRSLPPPITPPKSDVRKQKRQPARNSNLTQKDNTPSEYLPAPPFRASANICISHKLTKTIIADTIFEKFSDLFQYMNQAVALNGGPYDEDAKYDDEEKVLCFDFHHKDDTEQKLFCVIRPDKYKGYHWKMMDELLTAGQVPPDRLPHFPDRSLIQTIIDKEQSAVAQGADIALQKAKWSAIKVYSPQRDSNNKRRMTLSLDTREFRRHLSKQEIHLIPIMMFVGNNKEMRWRIEYVQIVRIDDHVDIGIAFVLNDEKNTVFVSGVHLEKEWIIRQLELLFRGRLVAEQQVYRQRLEQFQSNINHLRIGNLNEDANKIKDLRARCRRYQRGIGAVKDTANKPLVSSPSHSHSIGTLSASSSSSYS